MASGKKAGASDPLIRIGNVSFPRSFWMAAARMKAGHDLLAIDAQRISILRSFPGLVAADALATEQGAPTQDTPRRRRVMPDAERRAVSARMKRYWAERRKAKEALNAPKTTGGRKKK